MSTVLRRLTRKAFIDRDAGKLIELFRYAIVSGVSIAVDFGGLYLFTEYLDHHYLLSAAVSYTSGLFVNYVLSVLWVFSRSRLKSRAAEFLIFVAIGLVGLGVNEGLLWLLTDVILLHYMVSRSISAVIGFLWKFVLRKAVLFTGGPRERNALPFDCRIQS